MRQEKAIFYQNATKKLLCQIDTMKMTEGERNLAKRFMLLFRNSFQSDDVKRAVFGDILGTKLNDITYPSDGFCKASSSAFMAMMRGKKWRLMYIDEIWTYGPHFFLYHIPSKQNFDLTFDQYANIGIDVPYYLGRPETESKEQKIQSQRLIDMIGKNLDNLQHNWD